LEATGPDVQLVDINVTITAAAGALDDIKSRADAAGATWSEEDEDF
jgi:hypothetical protein